MGQLICPRCGAFTAPMAAKFPAYMTIRNGSSYRHELGQAEAITPDDKGWPVCGIMICQHCERHFVAEKTASKTWLAVYPLQHRPVAEEIPEPIKGVLDEASLCFTVGANIGCLLLCRTALIALQRQQGASNFEELKEKGVISDMLFRQANEVRHWANIVGHEDIDLNTVTKDDAEQLLTYLEAIFDAVYVQPARLSALAEKRKKLKQSDT